jgi:YVTN family beta-propeller protein
VTPDGSKVFVAIPALDSVSVIDTATNTVSMIAVVAEPIGVAVTPDGSKVYVSNFGSNTVSVIDTTNNTVITTIPARNGPVGVAMH